MNEANFPYQRMRAIDEHTVFKTDSATLTNEEVAFGAVVVTKGTAATITLPTAAEGNVGSTFELINNGAGDVTLTDGTKTQTVATNEIVTVRCRRITASTYEWFFTTSDSSGTSD